MADNPQCAALTAARQKTRLSYGQIAQKDNSHEQRIFDTCTSQVVPTQDEFNAIASALSIQNTPPNSGVHKMA